MKKALIFDMDGTLWDSSVQVAEAWNLAVKKNGIDRVITMADMQSVMGKTMDVIAQILFPMLSEEKRTALLESCCESENDYLREHGGVLYPDLRRTMEALKDTYHLYIVSNCQAGYIEAFLDYYQMWDLFEDIECFGNNGLQKGDNIALLYKRNELDHAAYVGDIQGDYDATMAAAQLLDKPLGFIHAAYGFGTIKEKVPCIQTLSELEQVAPTVVM